MKQGKHNMTDWGRWGAAAWVAVGMASAGAAQGGLPALGSVEGAVVRKAGDRLAVGTRQGGVVVYDGPSRRALFGAAESLRAPVADVLLSRDEVWWLVEGRNEVRVLRRGWAKPAVIELSAQGLTRPPLRLSGWRGGVFVHGDTDSILIDAQTRKGRRLEQALPARVAQFARQGVLTTFWDGERGILTVVRRYEPRPANRNPLEAPELNHFQFWSVDARGNWKSHGEYRRNLVRMQNAVGPRVEVASASGVKSFPYGWGPVGNIELTSLGIVALDYDRIRVIPFAEGRWTTAEIETPATPNYAQGVSTSTANAWWTDGRRVYCAGLEDGATDVYLPLRSDSRIHGVAADEDGAWVLVDRGVRRVVPWRESDQGFDGFVRYAMGDDEAVDTEDQERLADIAASVRAVDGVDRDPYAFVQRVYSYAGLRLPSRTEAMAEVRPERRVTGDIRYGDVLVDARTAAIYLGNGTTLRAQNGTLVRGPMRLDPSTRIVRYHETVATETAFLRRPPRAVAGDFSAPAVPQPWSGHTNPLTSYNRPSRRPWSPVAVGLGRPVPSLGHSRFVRIDRGGPWDMPHRPEHHRLLQIAQTYFDLPYGWGQNGPAFGHRGIDCSGFVHQVFGKLGVRIPRQSQAIGRHPEGEVVTDELRFGDVLVVPGHVLIYVGNGRTVETTRSSRRGGPGWSSLSRRSSAIVRRFIPSGPD